MAWREFSYSLLYYNPSIPQVNLQRKFDNFPWVSDSKLLIQWQKGQTGIPIVDAGMRELWQTGYMHNRVRMIVASFLVKNLLIDWRDGERWFWDCLIDADLANNSASWQWVAGTGADAAPYYRIFNPVTQGQKFDPDGHYTRRYVPELALLANKYLFNPWEAPEEILTAANVCLGIDYPHPLVDLKSSRARALELFKLLTTSQNITAPN
jgi:deoxyribodipyrimidine photo-lyase